MERYKPLYESGKNANPKKDGVSKLNIIQIIALVTIKTYRTGRLKSFSYAADSYDPRIFDQSQRKADLHNYLSVIGYENGNNVLLWEQVKDELKSMGFITGRGSLTEKGIEEIEKIKKYYGVHSLD